MYEIALLNSTTDSESLWMVLSILCTQSLFCLLKKNLQKVYTFYFSGHFTETNTTDTVERSNDCGCLVWFSLRVGGKCSIFQFYVYYWRQAFEFSLYQIKEIYSSRPSLLSSFKIFIINEYEILSNMFSGSIEMIMCVPHSANVVNCIDDS